MHWFLHINYVAMLNMATVPVIWIKFRLNFWEGLKKVDILFISDCFTQPIFCSFGKNRWKTNWRFSYLCKDCLKYNLWIIYQNKKIISACFYKKFWTMYIILFLLLRKHWVFIRTYLSKSYSKVKWDFNKLSSLLFQFF